MIGYGDERSGVTCLSGLFPPFIPMKMFQLCQADSLTENADAVLRLSYQGPPDSGSQSRGILA
jgi:hypothetical protein